MPTQRKVDQSSATIKAAEEYVRQQIAIMEVHGGAPKLSSDAFKAIVHQVAQAAK